MALRFNRSFNASPGFSSHSVCTTQDTLRRWQIITTPVGRGDAPSNVKLGAFPPKTGAWITPSSEMNSATINSRMIFLLLRMVGRWSQPDAIELQYEVIFGKIRRACWPQLGWVVPDPQQSRRPCPACSAHVLAMWVEGLLARISRHLAVKLDQAQEPRDPPTGERCGRTTRHRSPDFPGPQCHMDGAGGTWSGKPCRDPLLHQLTQAGLRAARRTAHPGCPPQAHPGPNPA